MSDPFAACSAFVVRRARLVLFLSLAIAAIVASGAGRLAVELDPEQQLPADHPYVAVDRRIRGEFGGRNFVAMAILPSDGTIWNSRVLEAVHGLTLDLLSAPGVIRQNVASLSSPYVRVVRDRGGVLAADYLMREVPSDAAGIEALRELYRSEPLVRGAVVSDDERAAMVLGDFHADRSAAEIAATVQGLAAKYRTPTLDIALVGEPILTDFENQLVGRQGGYFAGTLATILVILYLAFGQIQGVILPSATALLSTAAALGFMGIAGIPLNPWTTAVPIVVMTIAAGHSSQMLKRYYEEYARSGDPIAAVLESTTKIGPVMIAAGATAGCGFAALAVLGIPTLLQFGLGVAAGIFAAVFFEMTFMVALRSLWPSPRPGSGDGPLSRALGSALRALSVAVVQRPAAIVGGFGIVILASLAALPRLETDVDARRYWPETTEIGRHLEAFETHFPSTTPLTLLLEGEPGSMKTPEAMRVMRGLERAMRKDPGVGRTSSLAEIVERTWHVFAPETLGEELPEDPGLVSQLLFLADSPAFERFVDRSYSRSVVSGFLNRNDSGLTRRVIGRIEDYLAGERLESIRVSIAGGGASITLAVNEHTVRGKALNIVIVLATIFAIAALLLRSLAGAGLVVIPLVMVLVVNVGYFGWLGVAFDVAGATIAAVGIGIGADYAIYFLYRLREEIGAGLSIENATGRAIESSGRAILFVALAVGAGFSVYLVSDYYPLKLCGAFMPLTMLVSSGTSLTLLPALVALTRPRFLLGRASCGNDRCGPRRKPVTILANRRSA